MKKKDRGFTLIELMIAIAVLSVMAGVLFQVFVVSRRIDAKAAKEDVVQNAARRTMEELKAYSFERLDYAKEKKGTVNIAGTKYSYEPLKKSNASGDEADAGEEKPEGYLLKREYRVLAKEDEEAEYLIYAEADKSVYSAGETADGEVDVSGEKEVYSINNYQMPNIADVSSFQNVVIDPMLLAVQDQDQMGLLLAQVNPKKGAGEEEATGAAEEAETETVYTESDIKKYLSLNIGETDMNKPTGSDKGKLTAEARGVYTVSDKLPSKGGKLAEDKLTLSFSAASLTRKIEIDAKTGKPLNRIYLFLPDTAEVEFDKIYVTAKTDNFYELYIVVQNAESVDKEQYISIHDEGKPGTGDKNIRLYTNIGEEKPVSSYSAEDRLYDLTVTIYEADYTAGGAGAPKPGKELLRLDSTKSEQRSGAGKPEGTAGSK